MTCPAAFGNRATALNPFVDHLKSSPPFRDQHGHTAQAALHRHAELAFEVVGVMPRSLCKERVRRAICDLDVLCEEWLSRAVDNLDGNNSAARLLSGIAPRLIDFLFVQEFSWWVTRAQT